LSFAVGVADYLGVQAAHLAEQAAARERGRNALAAGGAHAFELGAIRRKCPYCTRDCRGVATRDE
jgi:hypothetical protein